MSAQVVVSLAEKIRRSLTQKNPTSLRRLLSRHNFADIAEVLESSLSREEAVACFQYLNIGQAAQVLASVNEELQAACIISLPTSMGSRILRMMPADDAVDILQEMDTSQSRRILAEMPYDTDTNTLRDLLMEQPDSAAGLMSPDFVQISIEATVGEAMHAIKRAEEKDFIYYVYLVDAEQHLVGTVSLKRLILHDESVPLNRIGEFDVKALLVNYDQEFVANIFRKYYNLLAMPVVDPDNVLRGIITLDDIVDVIDEESSEDLYRASGINIEEIDERGLLVGSEIGAFKARFPWLSITMVGQMLGSMIIAHFQDTVSAAAIAIAFMPTLTGLSGNMGTQTDTITVRGIAQGLITQENFKSKLIREIRVALLTGVSFAFCVGIITYLFYHILPLSLLLFVWIIISLCLSATMGMSIPYAVKHFFKVDPAGMGGPFITTLSDILTFTFYLSVVSMLLSHGVKLHN